MNKQPSPEIRCLMALAAEMRAGGATWESVAHKVQRQPRTCRAWPLRYPEEWERLFCAAEDALLAEAGSESLHFLRRLLRSEDEWLRQNTAKFLLTQRRSARILKREAAAAGQLLDKWGPFLAYLERLDDAEVGAFLEEFLARHFTPANPAPPPDPGEANPQAPG